MSTSAQTTRTPRRRVRELEVEVVQARRDTPDTTTLFMSTGDEPIEYEAGHFCTIDPHQFGELEHFTAYLEDQKGQREKPRAYSMASAPHEAAPRHHDQRGALRERPDAVPAAAVAAADVLHPRGPAAGHQRFYRGLYLSRRCLRAHRPHSPRVRWQRHSAQQELDQGKPAPRRPPPAHLAF